MQNLETMEILIDGERVESLANLYDSVKRILDVTLSIVGLVLSLPLFIIISIAIKFDSKGPIFADIPKRVTQGGKLFKMYKFRSMFVGAHEILHNNPKYRDLLIKYRKNNYKLSIKEDPRITRIGKFIRKTSLDELPQLINVVKGQMSLVGPRAYYPFELEEQQKRYPKSQKFVKIILSGKPGITGEWQVAGRSLINFDKRVEMDAGYLQKRSIWYDLLIMLKTVPAVLTGRGAV